MTDDLVFCPARGCFEGKRWVICVACDGGGYGALREPYPGIADPPPPPCGGCQGAGEVDSGECDTCGGTGRVTRAWSWLSDVADRHGFERVGRFAYLKIEPTRSECWMGGPVLMRYRQTHSGTTDYALLAYLSLRDELRDRVVEVGPVVVVNHNGNPQHALRLATDDFELILSGCSWGYGGEGCRGTAIILCDLGRFATLEEARSFVANLDGFGWAA